MHIWLTVLAHYAMASFSMSSVWALWCCMSISMLFTHRDQFSIAAFRSKSKQQSSFQLSLLEWGEKQLGYIEKYLVLLIVKAWEQVVMESCIWEKLIYYYNISTSIRVQCTRRRVSCDILRLSPSNVSCFDHAENNFSIRLGFDCVRRLWVAGSS